MHVWPISQQQPIAALYFVRNAGLTSKWVFLLFYRAPRPSNEVYYRPQRSCGKAMFLHLSVILFTGGSLSGGSLSRETPLYCRTVTGGRYASYWNVFLLWSKMTFAVLWILLNNPGKVLNVTLFRWNVTHVATKRIGHLTRVMICMMPCEHAAPHLDGSLWEMTIGACTLNYWIIICNT